MQEKSVKIADNGDDIEHLRKFGNEKASCLRQEAGLGRTVMVSGNKPEAIETLTYNRR